MCTCFLNLCLLIWVVVILYNGLQNCSVLASLFPVALLSLGSWLLFVFFALCIYRLVLGGLLWLLAGVAYACCLAFGLYYKPVQKKKLFFLCENENIEF